MGESSNFDGPVRMSDIVLGEFVVLIKVVGMSIAALVAIGGLAGCAGPSTREVLVALVEPVGFEVHHDVLPPVFMEVPTVGMTHVSDSIEMEAVKIR